MTVSRPFHELLHPEDAIESIRAWAGAAPHHVEVLPCPPEAGQRTLEALQVTTRSPLGALAYHTGGVLVDHRWLRILGAGCDRLPRALDGWNGLESGTRRFDQGMLVGDDVLGGFFAWFDEPRSIHYFGPDSLKWDDLQLGDTDWLASMLSDRLAPFYAALRWDGWERDVAALQPDEGMHVYPPLVMRMDGPRSRRAVPFDELWHVHMQLGRELNGLPDGSRVIVEPTR